MNNGRIAGKTQNVFLYIFIGFLGGLSILFFIHSDSTMDINNDISYKPKYDTSFFSKGEDAEWMATSHNQAVFIT